MYRRYDVLLLLVFCKVCFYMHPTFTALGEIAPTASLMGPAATPRPIILQRNSESLLEVNSVVPLV